MTEAEAKNKLLDGVWRHFSKWVARETCLIHAEDTPHRRLEYLEGDVDKYLENYLHHERDEAELLRWKEKYFAHEQHAHRRHESKAATDSVAWKDDYQTGQRQLDIAFGNCFFISLREDVEKRVSFGLGLTKFEAKRSVRYGFVAKADPDGGTLKQIIEEVRKQHPDLALS